MKTLVSVSLFCAVLYAGINTLSNTTSEINHHNEQLKNAVLAMKGE